MSDSEEPGTRPPRGGLHNLGTRTIAICVAAALVVALAVGLVASLALDDGSDAPVNTERAELTPMTGIDSSQLLSVGVVDPDDKTSTLEEHLDDKPLLVNLWARSCAPCIKEMPWLDAVATANTGIDVLGVNVQDNLSDAKVMAEQTGIAYPWVRDTDGEILVAVEASGLPFSLLIDPDGTVLATKLGAFSSQKDIEQWIASNL